MTLRKVPQKHTASGWLPGCKSTDLNDKVSEVVASAGKGEMVRQELTSDWVTSRLGKPHLEQDQIEGQKDARPSPRVGRLILVVTPGLDRWSPLRLVGVQNSAYRFA